MMFGHRGKILSVDLSSGETSEVPIEPKMARQFIGGAGLAARLLYDMIDAATDPLSPENPLLFLTGPFSGTMVPTGSKTSVCTKSPLTGLWAHSTVGGHLGADIKYVGYDGILLQGAADRPVYLFVDNSKVEIRGAEHLWGKDTEETWEALKQETGHRNPGVARIGVAGENLVKMANIIIDHHRAAGRAGLGAVMGSKKLKAVVVHGTDRKVPVADADRLQQCAKETTDYALDDPTVLMYTELGTAGYVDMASGMYGSLPAGYYTVPDFDSYNLSGTTVRETILVGKSACYRCPFACGRVIEVKEGKYATGKFAGPEYEATGSWGSLLLNDDLEALAYANKQLALLGIDTISSGNTIALAYYLYSEEKISSEDLDGLSPEWGEIDTALTLLEKMARREGVGHLLGEGSRAFGAKFGFESLAAQVNGLELPMHDPRGFSGLAVGYATSPRGACHMTADMYTVQMGQINESLGIESNHRFDNEAVITAKHQDWRCLTNSALICNFFPLFVEQLVELLGLVTGWDVTVEELALTGERIFTMMRLFNLKLGYDVNDEKLPEIVLRPLEGATEGHVPNVEEQLDTWYKFRDWSRKTGKPSKKKIEKLGLAGL
jgi:aldehyde:ferredoxin oxidoreductase